MQLSEDPLGLRDAGRQRDRALREPVQTGRSVEQQIPHLVERLDLRVEFAVRLPTRGDELHEHVALLFGCLGDVVVEALTDLEGVRQRDLRLPVRAVEGSHRRVPELAPGELERFGTGPHRVVGVHQEGLRVLVETLDRQTAQGGRVGRIDLRGLCGTGLGALLLRPPVVGVDTGTAGRDDTAADEQRRHRSGGRGEGVAQPVGCAHGGTRPVAVAQGRHDVGRADPVTLALGDLRTRRCPQRELAVVGRDRQQRGVGTEIARLRGGLRPTVVVASVEARHVGHPQLQTVLVVQSVRRFLDPCDVGVVEYARGVGDRLGEPRGWLRGGRRGKEQPRGHCQQGGDECERGPCRSPERCCWSPERCGRYVCHGIESSGCGTRTGSARRRVDVFAFAGRIRG